MEDLELYGPNKHGYVMKLTHEDMRSKVKDILSKSPNHFWFDDMLQWINWTTKDGTGDDLLNKLKEENLISIWGEDKAMHDCFN